MPKRARVDLAARASVLEMAVAQVMPSEVEATSSHRKGVAATIDALIAIWCQVMFFALMPKRLDAERRRLVAAQAYYTSQAGANSDYKGMAAHG